MGYQSIVCGDTDGSNDSRWTGEYELSESVTVVRVFLTEIFI